MAGFFPDAPAPRMAIDVDGTQGFWISDQAQVEQLTPTQMATINNEQPNDLSSAFTSRENRMTVIFPELREIAAVYPVVGTSAGGQTFHLEVSSDTTSGLDGTWEHVLNVSAGARYSLPTDLVSPGYRTPFTENLPVVARAIRLRPAAGAPSHGIVLFHIYGTIAPGEAAHRLAFWHPTLDEPMPAAWLDWGDIRQDTTGEQHFRVKNLSPSSTATGVALTMSALSVTESLAMHRFSVGAGDQVSTLPIGNLAPGAISPVITLHRDMTGAVLGLRALRLHAAATTWA